MIVWADDGAVQCVEATGCLLSDVSSGSAATGKATQRGPSLVMRDVNVRRRDNVKQVRAPGAGRGTALHHVGPIAKATRPTFPDTLSKV